MVFTPHQTFYPLKKKLQHRLIGPIKLLEPQQNKKLRRPFMSHIKKNINLIFTASHANLIFNGLNKYVDKT